MKLDPTVIGVAGGACSGKTTLSTMLLNSLPNRCKIISLDSYILSDQSNGPFTNADNAGMKFFDLNNPLSVDWERVIKEVSPDAGEQSQIIIVEGLFALSHDDLRDRMSLRIFIDYPADLRIARKIIRNSETKGNEPRKTFTNYLNSGRPGHEKYVEPSSSLADFVVSGERLESSEGNRTLNLITALIESISTKDINQ